MTTNLNVTEMNVFEMSIDKDTAYAWIENQKETRAGLSGARAIGFTKSRRKNQFSLMGSKEDRQPQEMTMTREGIRFTVKAEWMKKTDGTLNKKGVAEVERLVTEGLSAFSRSDIALEEKATLGRALTRKELVSLKIAELKKANNWLI